MEASSAEPKTIRGGDHTIVHGDGVSYLASMGDGSIDLAFVDPPYNIGKRFRSFHDSWRSESEYVEWCRSWLGLLVRKLSPTGAAYVMTSTQAMPHVDLYIRERMAVMCACRVVPGGRHGGGGRAGYR